MVTQTMGRVQATQTGEVYRHAREDEISETVDIVLDGLSLKARSVQSSSSTTRVGGRQPVVRLNPGDLTEEHVRALRERFEPKVQPRIARVVKGKGKAVSLTEEDIPRLRQQWQHEFADIANKTKKELLS